MIGHDPAPLEVRYLGRVPYRDAWALQRSLVEQRLAGEVPDTLLLLEHDPVITLGRDGNRDSLLVDDEALEARGVELVQSDRGGDATFHGPGQVVGYPILDLRARGRDVRRCVHAVEQTMIDTVADFGLPAERLASAPGIWLRHPDRKIGAVGMKIHRRITHHGFALNVNTDLDYFSLIVPCGIRDKGVTTMELERGAAVPVPQVMQRLAGHLARLTDHRLVFGEHTASAGLPHAAVASGAMGGVEVGDSPSPLCRG